MKLSNLAVLLGALVVSFSAIELYLRIDDHSSKEGSYTEYWWNGSRQFIFLDPERIHDPSNPLLVVGDSFVAGHKCGHQENMTGHLQSLFVDHGSPIDVLNLSRANTTPMGYLGRLHDYFAEYGNEEVSGIVVVLYSNDIGIFDDELCRWEEAIADDESLSEPHAIVVQRYCEAMRSDGNATAGLLSLRGGLDQALSEHSYLYKASRSIGAGLAAMARPDVPIGRLRFVEQWLDAEGLRFEVVVWALQRIGELAAAHGAPLVVAWYPNVEDLSEQAVFFDVARRVTARLSDRLGMPVHNGYEAFAGDPRARPRMVWSLTDDHPSCLAHEIYADWLFDELEPQLRIGD